jgi:hypothetical protein
VRDTLRSVLLVSAATNVSRLRDRADRRAPAAGRELGFAADRDTLDPCVETLLAFR